MTITVAEAAEHLGTTVPRVTRAIKRLGISPVVAAPASSGRRCQVLGPRDLLALTDQLGSIPPESSFSREELLVLAAFNQSPFGFRSVRAAARAAGVSPTTVGRILPNLVANGLVAAESRHIRSSGRVITATVYEADRLSDQWRAAQADIDAVRPPLPGEQAEPKFIPRRFWHLFWNTTPATLSIAGHADYIADRMLLSREAEAVAWAAVHLPPESIAKVATFRHTADRDRHWLRNLAGVMAEDRGKAGHR